MLRLVTAAVIAVCLFSCSANFYPKKKDGRLMGVLPLIDDRVVYEYRQDLPKGVSREEVFRRARRWFVNSYRSAKDVFQLNDKETGELIGKGYTRVIAIVPKGIVAQSYSYYSNVSIDVSQTDYLISIYNFRIIDYIGTRPDLETDTPIENYPTPSEQHTVAFYRGLDKQTLETIESIKCNIQQHNSRK